MTTITKLVNDFATDSVTREDETINFGLGPCVIGPDGPYAPNKQVWLLTLQARLAETTIENESYQTLWMVHDCNNITFRW